MDAVPSRLVPFAQKTKRVFSKPLMLSYHSEGGHHCQLIRLARTRHFEGSFLGNGKHETRPGQKLAVSANGKVTRHYCRLCAGQLLIGSYVRERGQLVAEGRRRNTRCFELRGTHATLESRGWNCGRVEWLVNRITENLLIWSAKKN